MSSDLQIVKDCLKGKRLGQRRLYDKYKTSLYMICQRYADSLPEAEDMLQESFISVYRDLHQYDPNKGKLYTWMRRVTINCALQRLRRKKMHFLELEEELIEGNSADTLDPVSNLQLSDLIQLIQKLPNGYRTVFNLYEIEGYSHNEIAEMLNISVGTSRSQFFKARKMLRALIESVSKKKEGKHV